MKIRIIAGTVGFYDSNGSYKTADSSSGIVDVSDDQAQSFIDEHVAKIVGDQPAYEKSVEPEQEHEAASEAPKSAESDSVEDMSYNELRAYAKKKGYDTKGCKTKNDYIERIKEYEDYEEAEFIDEDPDNELPDFDPVIPE